jgi:hypothetical protein
MPCLQTGVNWFYVSKVYAGMYLCCAGVFWLAQVVVKADLPVEEQRRLSIIPDRSELGLFEMKVRQ